jgi:hypothetical protein
VNAGCFDLVQHMTIFAGYEYSLSALRHDEVRGSLQLLPTVNRI